MQVKECVSAAKEGKPYSRHVLASPTVVAADSRTSEDMRKLEGLPKVEVEVREAAHEADLN